MTWQNNTPSMTAATPSETVFVGFEASGVSPIRVLDVCSGYSALTQRPGPHIQGNVFDHLNRGWWLAILHPSCTYLTCSAEWAYSDPDYDRYPGVGYHQMVKPGTLVGQARREAREAAIADFVRCDTSNARHIAIENPKGCISRRIRKPEQIIQPYEFGDDASKETHLWLRRLPPLYADPRARCLGRMVTDPRNGKTVERWANQTDSGQNRLSPSDDRWSARSETYPGIAAAMAEQWGDYIRAQRERRVA